MTPMRTFMIVAIALVFRGSLLVAQTPANDPSARLREVLPADVAERVIARIAEARARELPAAALEQRALKFAAKGVDAASIEKSVVEQADRLSKSKKALDAGLKRKASEDEVEAGAEAIRKGVDGAKVSELAKSAPSGRSLAVPLYVMSSLMDRGLPSDEAHKRVHEKLLARAADREIETLPAEVTIEKEKVARLEKEKKEKKVKEDKVKKDKKVKAEKPETEVPEVAKTKNPKAGPPAGVPGNAGKSARPTPPGQVGKMIPPGKGAN